MARQTKSEIDAEILDRAAALFARHGFERTSIQQIADALQYSKAGLLHHYSSKKLLFEAVLNKYESESKEQMALVQKVPAGVERDRALIENAIEFSFKWPGLSALAQQLAREGQGEDPRFVRLGLLLFSTLGIDLAAPDMERLFRAFSALSGANLAARFAVTLNMERECRGYILAAAMDALGHSDHGEAQTHSS